jgi:dTDP-4-dehydrorhamnose reductase
MQQSNSKNWKSGAAMRSVVVGSAGQLGRDLCPQLAGEVVALTRAEIELTRPDSVQAALKKVRPDVVFNCAAYNQVDRAEAEPEATFAVNTLGVRTLAECCRELGCTLVHFSSDYVFGLDVSRQTPYEEDDAPGPLGVYGLSKLAGEYLVRAMVPKHIVIRTCGLYGLWGQGGKGGNFVETMLRVAGQGKSLRVVADQICTPSYTVDVATAAAQLVQRQACGLYHLTNAGSCSWYEFARAIFEIAGVSADLSPIPSAEWAAAARRPGYSVLATGRAAAPGIALRPWREAVTDYLRERDQRERAR